MRYVSQIFSGFNGKSINFCFCDSNDGFSYAADSSHMSEIVITSESGKSTERFHLRDLNGCAIIGVGHRKGSGTVSACVHTKKTMQFHKYVHPVAGGSPDIDKRYTIGFHRSSISCFGYLGSVVEYRDDFSSYSIFFSLYDAFIALSRSTGKNLLEYDMIILESRSTHISALPRDMIYLKVSQTDEAKRFYTKMMLDVVGKYRRDLVLR